MKYGEKEEYDKFPSLYDAFELGERVLRARKDKSGQKRVYKGIILAINNKGMEIFWDTKDDKFMPPGADIDFTYCEPKEVFKGKNDYSPIKRDLNY